MISNTTQETDESIFNIGQSSNPIGEEGHNNGLAVSITKRQEILHRTRQTTASIPESKGAHLLSSLRFSCNIMCNQFLSYKLDQSNLRVEELDKLDVVLTPNSSILIHCKFLLNGLDVLEYQPDWIKETLDKVMESCGFMPSVTTDNNQDLFSYTIKKAFVTTPLSYLLVDQSASHAVLDRLDLIFNWPMLNKCKEFQSAWKRKLLHHSQMNAYMTHLIETILRKTCYLYPLIFNNAYVKRLSQTVAYVPHIAHSLQKVLTTSKATMSVDNHAFSQDFEQKLKVIEKNTQVMVQQHDSVRDTLTLGMYYSVRHATQPKGPPSAQTITGPPNALCTISLLWSASYSSQLLE